MHDVARVRDALNANLSLSLSLFGFREKENARRGEPVDVIPP